MPNSIVVSSGEYYYPPNNNYTETVELYDYVWLDLINRNPCKEITIPNDEGPATHRIKHAVDVF